MSNPYYNYSGAFIPGTLARAEAEQVEFTAVQTGFGLLTVAGVDSGAANAYVVNVTSGGPSGAYADGQIVEFKATNSNSGASTINVNSIGVVGLVQPNGQSLAGGAIVANTWYHCQYNSTYSAWTVIAPTSTVITSNTISASAPTFKVGLTAAGGVSTACAPIDVVFALDQSIAPTWTGAHIFGAAVTFNSSVTFTGGLSLTGAAAQYAATLTGNSTAGSSRGLLVDAGVNASDIALLVNSQNGATQFFEINGVGSVTVGTPAGGAQGVGTINAQGLFVNGAAVITSAAPAANPTASVGLAAVNGTSTAFMRSDAAPPLSQAIAPTWTGTHVFSPAAGGTGVTHNALANTIGLQILGGTNTANAWLAQMISAQASGFSSGLLIQAGTTKDDSPLEVLNAAATQVYFQTLGNGENYIFEPTTSNIVTGCHQVGYLDAPQILITASGTFSSLAYRGKAVTHASGAAHTVTIPVNGATPFPVGSTILLVVELGANTLTVQPGGTATLNWAGNGAAAGARVLTAPAMATLHKHSTDTWMISGAGIS